MSSMGHELAVKKNLDEAFPDLTVKELTAILQFAKLVRFRARNNAALDSMCHRLFPEFDVKHIKVTYEGKTYTKMMFGNVS